MAIDYLRHAVKLYKEMVDVASEIIKFSNNYGLIKKELEDLENG